MRLRTRRHFDFKSPKDYSALTEDCLALAEDERLEVNIADRAVQSPEGLAVRLNDDLGAQGIRARAHTAWYGSRRPKDGKVIVERAPIKNDSESV